MEYYLKSFEIYEELGIKHAMATVLSNIGSIYNSHGDIDQVDDICVIGVRV